MLTYEDESVNSRLREEGNALTKQRTEKKKATSEEEVRCNRF
jgi:hypothetical protein